MFLRKIIIDHLETLEVKYDQHDLVLILLYLLPFSYISLRDTILHSYDTLTIDKVYDVLFLKEKMRQFVFGSKAHEEGLVVHGGYVRDKLKSNYSNKIRIIARKWAHHI